MDDYAPEYKYIHPGAKELMKESFYFDPIEATAPFGNDDGADAYAGFKEWRVLNKTISPKQFLIELLENWNYNGFDFEETDLHKLTPYLDQTAFRMRMMIGTDAAIIAIAFGQLYLEGSIDNDFKTLTIKTLKRELQSPLLIKWGDYKAKRQHILETMLRTLEMMK